MSGISTADFGKLVRARRTEKRWTLEELAHHALRNADRKGYVSQIETGKLSKISALTVQKLAGALGIESELIDRVLGVVAPETTEAQEDVAELRRKYGSLQDVLDDLTRRTRADLIALATQFGIDQAFEMRTADLHALLESKAEEYRSLRAQIERIDERVAGLGNLKAAARDAAERLDFAEVEALLSRVDQVETENAAETKELRAANALLRGRPDEAFAHFTAAAASFAGIDRLEPARRSFGYSEQLGDHGLRYGGDGLRVAAHMAAAALQTLSPGEAPDVWGALQINLGNVLSMRGQRTAGAEGAALIGEAVAAYRAVLKVYTEDRYALAWAGTQNNLGNALSIQGRRTADAEGATPLLGEAVAAFQAAIAVYADNRHTLDWARTQNNLGNALQSQGDRTDGTEGAVLLGKAVAAFRAACSVYTEDRHALAWATTQNNLGNALTSQGQRTAGAKGGVLLTKADKAYRAALRVRTKDQHAVNWAGTRRNLAILEFARAHHDSSFDPAPPLYAALDHINAALQVYDPTHLATDYVTAITLRDWILAAIASLPP